MQASVRFWRAVLEVARVLLWWERSPHGWGVPRGTGQRRGF